MISFVDLKFLLIESIINDKIYINIKKKHYVII